MDNKPHILIVDDEPRIRLLVATVLQTVYQVTTASNGEEALALASKTRFDLALLDLNLPGMNGLELLKSIKDEQPYLAVVMLTGCGTIESAVDALRHGAANYLEKPATNQQILESVRDGLAYAQRERERNAILLKAKKFLEAGMEELAAIMPNPVDLRAEAQLPAETAPVAPQKRFIQRGPLLIDTYERKATLNEELLDLTSGEFDLLHCLASHAPRVLDPQELVKETRGFECRLTEAREIIRWQIYLLRQKLEIDPSSPEYILNVRGKGYMWAAAG